MEPFRTRLVITGLIAAIVALSLDFNSLFFFSLAGNLPLSTVPLNTTSTAAEHQADTVFFVKSSTIAMQHQLICIDRGKLISTKTSVSKNPFDNGGVHPYLIPRVANLSNKDVNFWPLLVVGWFSCEANLHHFITETLQPVRDAVLLGMVVSSGRAPLLAIAGSHSWSSDGISTYCHGPRYASMFQAIGVQQVVYFQGDGRLTENATRFYPSENEIWNSDGTYCFDHTIHARPMSMAVDLGQSLMVWAGKEDNHCDEKGLHVVIVQRQDTRHILNVENLVSSAKEMENIQKVSVVQFESMSIKDQMAFVSCGKVIFVGVQGAGLQWATFLKYSNQRSALIEITWQSWPPYYQTRVKSPNMKAFTLHVPNNMASCPLNYSNPECCDRLHVPNASCAYPTKDFDVMVPISSWHSYLQQGIAFICNDAVS